jgi:crotonobetainyl-CoA:carnitine CoA-transferase CaiB-like acyl-CoA transferase
MPLPRTGPAVGEHNGEVYAEFGIDAAELERLRLAQVV